MRTREAERPPTRKISPSVGIITAWWGCRWLSGGRRVLSMLTTVAMLNPSHPPCGQNTRRKSIPSIYVRRRGLCAVQRNPLSPGRRQSHRAQSPADRPDRRLTGPRCAPRIRKPADQPPALGHCLTGRPTRSARRGGWSFPRMRAHLLTREKSLFGGCDCVIPLDQTSL